MKRVLKCLTVAGTMIISTFAFEPAYNSAVTVIAREANIGQRSVYNTNCASCHGRDGHANTAKGRETDADDLTTGKVKGMSASTMSRIIRNGKGDMPGFGKKLSAAQITALVKFVKTL